jgi:hypothetical protein
MIVFQKRSKLYNHNRKISVYRDGTSLLNKRNITFASVSIDNAYLLSEFVHFIFLQSNYNIINDANKTLAPALEIARLLAIDFSII